MNAHPRNHFPVRRTCHHKSCKKAVVVCMGCMRRTCAHLSNAAGYVDLDTGTRKNVTFRELTARSLRLLPLGFCGACRLNPSAIANWPENLTAIIERVTTRNR